MSEFPRGKAELDYRALRRWKAADSTTPRSSGRMWLANNFRRATHPGMNATAAQLDTFLNETDPATARTVEQIVRDLIRVRSRRAEGVVPEKVLYRLPSRHLGAAPGADLTKLAHLDEEGD